MGLAVLGPFGDPASLRNLAGELQGVHNDVNDISSFISSGVNALVPGSWSGGAAGAFSSHWSTESLSMSELGITSDTIASVLLPLASSLEQANALALEAAAAGASAVAGVIPNIPNSVNAMSLMLQ